MLCTHCPICFGRLAFCEPYIRCTALLQLALLSTNTPCTHQEHGVTPSTRLLVAHSRNAPDMRETRLFTVVALPSPRAPVEGIYGHMYSSYSVD